MKKFEVGDIIICTKAYGGNEKIVGEKGVVKEASYWFASVEFFNDVDGHDGCGQDGRCWNFANDDGGFDCIKHTDFTQDDLKDYMLVVCRGDSQYDGYKYIVCKDGTKLCNDNGFNGLNEYHNFLCVNGHSYDIIEVYSEDRYNPLSLDTTNRTLLYKEKAIKKMTLREVCDKLGEEIELIPEEAD